MRVSSYLVRIGLVRLFKHERGVVGFGVRQRFSALGVGCRRIALAAGFIVLVEDLDALLRRNRGPNHREQQHRSQNQRRRAERSDPSVLKNFDGVERTTRSLGCLLKRKLFQIAKLNHAALIRAERVKKLTHQHFVINPRF